MIDPIAVAWPPGHKHHDPLDWLAVNSRGPVLEGQDGCRYRYSPMMATENLPKNMKRIK